MTVDADVMNPRSEELERAYDLEQYDRMIANPIADQEEAFRLLLTTNPKTKKDPDKFIATPALMTDPLALATAQAQGSLPPQQGGMPAAGNSPLNALGGQAPLPQAVTGTTQ